VQLDITPRRCVREWRYSLTHSALLSLGEVKLYTPAVLYPGKGPQYTLEVAGGTRFMFCGEDKNRVPLLRIHPDFPVDLPET